MPEGEEGAVPDGYEPGWRPAYTGDDGLSDVGSGTGFGVDLYQLYIAGRVTSMCMPLRKRRSASTSSSRPIPGRSRWRRSRAGGMSGRHTRRNEILTLPSLTPSIKKNVSITVAVTVYDRDRGVARHRPRACYGSNRRGSGAPRDLVSCDPACSTRKRRRGAPAFALHTYTLPAWSRADPPPGAYGCAKQRRTAPSQPPAFSPPSG